MKLEKYSMGIGDRFGCQGEAQLSALRKAAEKGVAITPVWNKSEREHQIIGTSPDSVRKEADTATAALAWNNSYRVDADHINVDIVDKYLKCSDFFTLDVADSIGGPIEEEEVQDFLRRHESDLPVLESNGLPAVSFQQAEIIARKYLPAVKSAAVIYHKIATELGKDHFIAEVSMDETDQPQDPSELFLILAGVSEAGIRAQTIAPKFSGRFNKGVDYIGDTENFQREFEADVKAVKLAREHFALPSNLKLSIHSGSDKFSLYPRIKEILNRSNEGVHLKTAGTTWLEEAAGLAMAEGEGLVLVKEIYSEALRRFEELCAPYAAVIDINRNNLPEEADFAALSGAEAATVIRHNQQSEHYNSDVRQLLHVGYKVAAQMGERYHNMVNKNQATVGEMVRENIYKHAVELFPGL